ncbi:hypothetical protein L1887_56005 [Cichorium endivia]|nr:hypothetical protein L1887_56005 [Cichorium endivia]
MDISADLTELGRTPVAVFCSGPKSILDIPRTLEVLETFGVSVTTFNPTGEFPAFYTSNSGLSVPYAGTDAQAAAAIFANAQLGLQSGHVFANPIPAEWNEVGQRIQQCVEQAVRESVQEGIDKKGKEVTPWLLKRLAQLIPESKKSNRALVVNNAKKAAQVAVELSRIENEVQQAASTYALGGIPQTGEVDEPLLPMLLASDLLASPSMYIGSHRRPPSSNPSLRARLSSQPLSAVNRQGGHLDVRGPQRWTLLRKRNRREQRLSLPQPPTLAACRSRLAVVARNMAETATRILSPLHTRSTPSPVKLVSPHGDDDFSILLRTGLEHAGMRTDGHLRALWQPQNGGFSKHLDSSVFDGNIGQAHADELLEACRAYNASSETVQGSRPAVLTVFEPTSVAKSATVLPHFAAAAADGNTKQPISFTTPNAVELDWIHAAALDYGLLDPTKIQPTRLASSVPSSVLPQTALHKAHDLVQAGIFGTILLKVGRHGVVTIDISRAQHHPVPAGKGRPAGSEEDAPFDKSGRRRNGGSPAQTEQKHMIASIRSVWRNGQCEKYSTIPFAKMISIREDTGARRQERHGVTTGHWVRCSSVHFLDQTIEPSSRTAGVQRRHCLALIRQATVEDFDAPWALIARLLDGCVDELSDGQEGSLLVFAREEPVAPRPDHACRPGLVSVGRRCKGLLHPASVADLEEEDLVCWDRSEGTDRLHDLAADGLPGAGPNVYVRSPRKRLVSDADRPSSALDGTGVAVQRHKHGAKPVRKVGELGKVDCDALDVAYGDRSMLIVGADEQQVSAKGAHDFEARAGAAKGKQLVLLLCPALEIAEWLKAVDTEAESVAKGSNVGSGGKLLTIGGGRAGAKRRCTSWASHREGRGAGIVRRVTRRRRARVAAVDVHGRVGRGEVERGQGRCCGAGLSRLLDATEFVGGSECIEVILEKLDAVEAGVCDGAELGQERVTCHVGADRVGEDGGPPLAQPAQRDERERWVVKWERAKGRVCDQEMGLVMEGEGKDMYPCTRYEEEEAGGGVSSRQIQKDGTGSGLGSRDDAGSDSQCRAGKQGREGPDPAEAAKR